MEELLNQIREAMKASLRTIEWGKIPYQPITLCRLLEGLIHQFAPFAKELSTEMCTIVEDGMITRIATLTATLSEVQLLVKFLNKEGKIDIEVFIKSLKGEPLYAFQGYEKYKSFERENSDLSLLKKAVSSLSKENYIKVLEIKKNNPSNKMINTLADSYISLFNSVNNVGH